MIADSDTRRELARSSFVGFCVTYLPHYFTLPSADFHAELIDLLQDWNKRFLAIAGFRGSAKSSLSTVALVLWAALEGKSRFILTVNETDDVVKLTIANLRQELEQNKVLKADYGNMIVSQKGGRSSFSETNILLANGCRIMGRSRGQKIRGLRHREHRPDLVVLDDVEELGKVDKKEYRDKTELWIVNAIIPAIEESKARLLIIGNMMHSDGLMQRLKANVIFTYREYPLIRGEEKWENCTWKGKYPTPESLKAKQDQVKYRSSWLREYLLKVVPPEGQEIKQEWIQYYDDMPSTKEVSGTGIDLAISKKETADYTTMVSGSVVRIGEDMRIYVHPNPIEARLSFHETMQQAKAIAMANTFHNFYVEQVAYQQAAVEEMQRAMLSVTAMRAGQDKRARLRAVAHYIQTGMVKFPRKGCEDLINQLIDFGVADHDDLVDALVYLIFGLVNSGLSRPEVFAI